jgi:hypothetical protein
MNISTGEVIFERFNVFQVRHIITSESRTGAAEKSSCDQANTGKYLVWKIKENLPNRKGINYLELQSVCPFVRNRPPPLPRMRM